jgi:small acid-soluble spore protein D (minor alpha/beta-type SASP)
LEIAEILDVFQNFQRQLWGRRSAVPEVRCSKSMPKQKEREVMKNNNQINVPQAREAMDHFKMQAAQEVGVNLTNGYNGHLTSREAGSVGGQMVKSSVPIRTFLAHRHIRTANEHKHTVKYIAVLSF